MIKIKPETKEELDAIFNIILLCFVFGAFYFAMNRTYIDIISIAMISIAIFVYFLFCLYTTIRDYLKNRNRDAFIIPKVKC